MRARLPLDARRRAVLGIAGVAVLGALVRFGTLALVFPPYLQGDELYYVDTALHLAQGEGHYSATRRAAAGWPPAHSFLLSLVADPAPGETFTSLSRENRLRFYLVEATLATSVVALIALLGWSLFDPRTGILAGLVASIHPVFVAYSHYLWSTNLFLVLELTALLAAIRVARTGSRVALVTAGIAFGLATLTREEGAVVAGCVALWWAWCGVPAPDPDAGGPPTRSARRTALACGALLLGCTVIVVVPWTARNYARFGRIVPVSTVGWLGMREGNTFGGPDWLRPHEPLLRAFRNRYFTIPDEMERLDMARRESLELIRQEQPAWILKKAVRNSALFFSPNSFLFRKLSGGSYGSVPLGVTRTLLVAGVVAHLALVTAALLGVALARRRGLRLLPLLVVGAVFGLHMLANASSRYRLPIMPFVLVYASSAILGWRRLPSVSRGEWAVVAAAGAAIVVWPFVYFVPDAVSLWNTGAYLAR